MNERWKISEDERPGMEWNRHIYIAGTNNRVCFMANSGDPAKDKERAELIALAPVMEDEIEGLRKALNTQLLSDFTEAVQREAAHQVARWGEGHDAGKSPEDWLWLIAYLATKATQAARYGDRDKYLHHIVTQAAACANWHRHALAEPPRNREWPK